VPTALTSSDELLSVDALDHQPQPTAPSAAERRRLALALILAGALHLLIPLAIVLFYTLWPTPPAPRVEEIPVEVVVEPPPPPPEKQQDKPKPPPQPDDERPAYDAPRAATQEKANRESPDDKTQAPQTNATPSPSLGAPQPSEAPQAAPESKAAAAPPEEAKPAQNPDEMAADSAAPSDAEKPPPAPSVAPKPAPAPAPKPPEPAVGAPLPHAEELPQYKFAAAATEAPMVGGNADTRYFTVVFGMIRSRLREPPPAPTHGGAIVFTVDESGNLVQRKVISSSGSPSLDVAMMNAIAEAAPYPPPPDWQPRSMRLVYGK
jgi:TonB family protein